MGKSNRERYEKGKRASPVEGQEGGRGERLQTLIREEANLLLRNELRDPLLQGVEITMVELSGDGSRARLWFSTEVGRDPLGALERAAGYIRVQLAESLSLKRTPELRFRRDPSTRTFAEAEKNG